MDIVFLNERMAGEFNSLKSLTRRFGPEQARRIMRRLDELRAAENLEAMRHLPGHCHELTGDLAGLLSMYVRHPQRLIFEPANEPVPRKADGGLDWSGVTSIRIIEVEDYHG